MNIRHRMHGTPTYESWHSMKNRCNNLGKCSKKNYYDKGITYDPRWEKFENFYADMGEKPAGMTLDRKDNNGPYAPWNCRWATPAEQTRNRTITVFLTFNGETLCVKDWADRIGVSTFAVHRRIRLGWDAEKVLTHPFRKHKNRPEVSA